MADYTPTLGDFTELKPFRFWCQKVLPLVYDDSLSYYELLCKVVDYLNKTMEDVDTMHDDVVNLHSAYVQLQTYVNTYFDNLDVQEEINNKLDAMARTGDLTNLISPFIPDLVTDWLDENITPTTPAIDKTFSVEGAGADSLRVGESFNAIGVAGSGEISRGMNENILDTRYVLKNCYHGIDGSTIVEAENLYETPYIPVVPGCTYETNTRSFIKWYDKDTTFISATPSEDALLPFKAPAGAYYAVLVINVTFEFDQYFRQFQAQVLRPDDWTTKIKRVNIEGYEKKNLINKHIVDHGCYPQSDDGKTWTIDENFATTEYIPVKVGELYHYSEANYAYYFYDDDFEYIGFIPSNKSTLYFTPLVGAAYMRVAFYETNIDTVSLYDESSYIEEGVKLVPKNLIDFTTDIIYHGFYNTMNVLVANDTFNQTDYIEVDPHKCYACQPALFVCCYDANKEYLGYASDTGNKGYIQPLPSSKYARFIFSDTNTAPYVYESDNFVEYQENNLAGLKYTGFGDSITWRENWCRTVANKFGLLFTNCGTGSAPISGQDSRALWKDAKINAVIASNPDIVTIMGGANDLVLNPVIGTEAELSKALADKDKDTFIGAYSYIIETLLNWKKTLKIVILGTTWSHHDGKDYSNTVTYTDFSNACKTIAEYYGLPFVNLHDQCGFNQFTMTSTNQIYSSDSIHPNYLGGNIIASLVAAEFEKCFKYL